MLLLTIILFFMSFCFEITIYSAEQYREIGIKNPTTQQYDLIGYINGQSSRLVFFNQTHRDCEEEISNEDVNWIRNTPNKSVRQINLKSEIAVSTLSDYTSFSAIAQFMRNTNLPDDPRKYISDMINAAQNFQLVLDEDSYITLNQNTFLFLSNFVTTICDPTKQGLRYLERNALVIFLNQFKQSCDTFFSQKKEILHSKEKKREIIFTVAFCALLIAGMLLEYKNKKNPIVQKCFFKAAGITSIYMACILLTSPIIPYARLLTGHKEYTNMFKKIIADDYFL